MFFLFVAVGVTCFDLRFNNLLRLYMLIDFIVPTAIGSYTPKGQLQSVATFKSSMNPPRHTKNIMHQLDFPL